FVAEAARPLADCVAHRVAALAEEAGDARVPPERRRRAAERRARLAGDGARLVTLVETLRGLDGARTPAGHVRALGRVLRDLRLRPVPRGALRPAPPRREPALARRDEARGKPPGGREAPPEARPARRGPAARRPLPHRARGEPRGPVPLLPGPLDGRARARALVPGSERAGEPDRPLALPRRGAGDGRGTAAAHG